MWLGLLDICIKPHGFLCNCLLSYIDWEKSYIVITSEPILSDYDGQTRALEIPISYSKKFMYPYNFF